MLERLYTSSKVIPITMTDFQNVFMLDWDAFLVGQGSYVYKIFRDGTTINMGYKGSGDLLANNKCRVFYYNPTNKRIYETCPFTSQPIYTQEIPSGLLTLSAGDFIDADYGIAFCKVGRGYSISAYNLLTGVLISTFTIGQVGNVEDGYYNLTSAGEGRFCAVSTNGYVTIYDYRSWEVVQKSQLQSTVKCGVYDPRYYVLLTVNSDGTTSVYSLEELGTGLSAPVFIPTGNKYLYSGYIVVTRFLGSGNSPMASKWINWEVLGSKGFLEKDYSLTDENGYAYNYFWTTTDISGIGSETIRVWCEI